MLKKFPDSGIDGYSRYSPQNMDTNGDRHLNEMSGHGLDLVKLNKNFIFQQKYSTVLITSSVSFLVHFYGTRRRKDIKRFVWKH